MSTSKESGEEHVAVHGDKFKGVRINCNGDIDFTGAARYIAVEVAFDDPVFWADIVLVSEGLQVTIRMRKCPPYPVWEDDGGRDRYENQAATFLMRTVDPSNDGWWAIAPMAWQNSPGSVIVVRADRKDITPQQVEAISHYSQHELKDAFQDALESESQEERVKVAALFTPGKFREFFDKFKAEKVREDPSWEAAICPA